MRLRSPALRPGTPAELFVSRYEWLARWAMQFARNDRTIADDLIQDTFLRFSQANHDVDEIRDPEALLYTYLEHVHLAHLREVTRHSFVSLADAQLDALALGLLTGLDLERIEAQNVLRRIAAYVAWRKQTSKSASIVALRFFHGFLPEEIARIALISREAVDERVHKGRNEIRLHLLDSAKLREIQHGGPADVFPTRLAVSTDELHAELRNQLFRAPRGACLSREQLALRYRESRDAPIRRELLAHFVGCLKCLTEVERISRQSQGPHAPGGSGGFTGMEGRGSRWSLPHVPAKKNVMARAQRRLKEIFEHRPSSLIVAVNGEILASRDIRAVRNGLKVEVPARTLRFVEILSESGASLLSWALESAPPHAAPSTCRETEFSMGRRLEVDLQYSGQRAIIDVQYTDPSHREMPSPSFEAFALEDDDAEDEPIRVAEPRTSAIGLNLLKQWIRFGRAPLIAAGFACVALLSLTLLFRWQGFSRVQPEEYLARAATSEQREAHNANSGIILQRVSIRSNQGVFEHTIYRDPKGRRRAKQQALDEARSHLKARLAMAGIDWDAPLSARSFREWQARGHILSESVRNVDDKILTLSVRTDQGDVAQETLTIRRSDFHPIGRTAELRDLGTIEVAELDYAVIPLENINQDLFEDQAGPSDSLARATRPLQLSPRERPVSDVELDVAELEARTVLHELHADSSDRLTITRNTNGLVLGGFAEDQKQKLDIEGRLHLIPYVSTKLKTLSQASEQAAGDPPAQSVRVASVVAEPSLLEAYLSKQGRSREVANELADTLFRASSSLVRANRALLELQQRFPSGEPSSKALELYEHLLASWYSDLDDAMRAEADAIQQAGIQLATYSGVTPEPIDMSASIETNRILVKELIGHDDPNGRTAPAVLAELSHSLESLRRAAKVDQERAIREALRISSSARVSHP